MSKKRLETPTKNCDRKQMAKIYTWIHRIFQRLWQGNLILSKKGFYNVLWVLRFQFYNCNATLNSLNLQDRWQEDCMQSTHVCEDYEIQKIHNSAVFSAIPRFSKTVLFEESGYLQNHIYVISLKISQYNYITKKFDGYSLCEVAWYCAIKINGKALMIEFRFMVF